MARPGDVAPVEHEQDLFEATKPGDGHSEMMGGQYNNNFFAAVATWSSTSRPVGWSVRGAVLGDLVEGNGLGVIHCPSDDFLHFADTRYEIRDAQYLVGRRVDQGLMQPGFAVTSESYGAGQSLLHAASATARCSRTDAPSR